jgi:glycosyltransferase involved in cell wall biosynthesis
MPRVSVIACVYNLEDIVLETVRSILDQTYGDFEFIIVDDGSTDRTVERLKSVIDPRFKVVCAPHSGLPAVGRNRALAAATPHEFIAIADADDVWLPERLQKQIDFFDRHPQVSVVHSQVRYLIEGRVTDAPDRRIPSGPMNASDVLRRLLHHNFIYNPTVLIRTSALNRTNGFYNEDPQLCGPEDFDLWLRLAETGASFGFIDEPLVLYRIRPDSVSRNRARNLNGDIVALNDALNRSPPTYAELQCLVRNRLAYLHRELAGCKFRSGASGAWSNWRQAVKYSPWNFRTWSWGLLGLVGSKSTEQILTIRRQWKERNAAAPTVAKQVAERVSEG